MVEGARLESVCALIAYRGFESRPVRQFLTSNVLLFMIDFELFLPWELLVSGARGLLLEAELKKELGKKHILFELPVKALAVRRDQDDVLFEIDDVYKKYAVVHLTWGAHPDPHPTFPSTEIFESIAKWKEQMLKDNQDY